ncbi:MAG: hypothetical protein HKM95_08020 [Inquilinus sp.]|nr:hypothetical protein [Inquilinus sp.]
MGLGSIISAAGAVVGALSGLSAGNENARLAAYQAERERERTRVELERQRRFARQVAGTQQVQFAAAGVRGDSGSALDILADTAADAALDARLIEAGGSLREAAAMSEAKLQRSQGRSVFVGGLLSGAAEWLG